MINEDSEEEVKEIDGMEYQFILPIHLNSINQSILSGFKSLNFYLNSDIKQFVSIISRTQ